jgi:hypothetical protein
MLYSAAHIVYTYASYNACLSLDIGRVSLDKSRLSLDVAPKQLDGAEMRRECVIFSTCHATCTGQIVATIV